MQNPLTPAGIEPATYRFVAQHLNHCATAVPIVRICHFKISFGSGKGLGFLSSKTLDKLWGHPKRKVALFLGVKPPEYEAQHSPSTSSRVKELLQRYLHAHIRRYGAHSHNFTFIFV